MLDLTVIILTFNEEIHIRRVLDNVTPIAKEVVIVDSFSTDKTLDIAGEYPNVRILQHVWENNHAKQFNWGLKEADIKTEWILRLDADEYLEKGLIERIKKDLASLPREVSAVSMRRKHTFMGKFIKGGNGHMSFIRLFRNGKAHSEERLMDEHIEVLEGETVNWKEAFVDDNLNDLTWWTAKHNNYATREAMARIAEESAEGSNGGSKKKGFYYKLPPYWRAFAYFLYRYFLRGGFLEGKAGFMWCFLQGWWYRTLVDGKIEELRARRDEGRARRNEVPLENRD